MTDHDFKELERGDIVRHVGRADSWVVLDTCRQYAILASATTLMNPQEWDVVLKKNHKLKDDKMNDTKRDWTRFTRACLKLLAWLLVYAGLLFEVLYFVKVGQMTLREGCLVMLIATFLGMLVGLCGTFKPWSKL